MEGNIVSKVYEVGRDSYEYHEMLSNTQTCFYLLICTL